MGNKSLIEVTALSLILISALAGIQAIEMSQASSDGLSTSGSSPNEWPTFMHDSSRSGYSSSEAPLTNQTLWNFSTGGAVESSPVVVGGVVYVGSDDGYVYALNASTGTKVWSYNTYGPVQSAATVLNGVVYFGGFHSHAIFALNASSGALIWNSPTTSAYPNEISSTAVANGLVYVDLWNQDESGGELEALNASTGDLVWNYLPGSWLASSPSVYCGKVYIGTTGVQVEALDATSGNSSWSYAAGSVFGSLLAKDGLVYVGTAVQTVLALNASSGEFVWTGITVGADTYPTPAIANGVVYVATTLGEGNLNYGEVTALNAKSGTMLWNTPIGSMPMGSIQQSSPAVAGGVIYVGSGDNNIYALDATSGTIVWSYLTGGAVYSSPAVAYGVVYVCSNDGKIYAIGTYQSPPPSPTPSPTPTESTSASPTPSPSVPELPERMILPFLFSASLLVLIFRRRKNSKPHERAF